MTLKTSKGKTFIDVRYCNYYERQKELIICINDARDILEIANDFHGVDEIKLIVLERAEFEDVKTYTGFNKLRSIEKDIYGTDKVIMYLGMGNKE